MSSVLQRKRSKQTSENKCSPILSSQNWLIKYELYVHTSEQKETTKLKAVVVIIHQTLEKLAYQPVHKAVQVHE